MNGKQIVIYGLLLLLVTGSGWFLFQQESGLQRTSASSSGADAFVEEMDLKVMNEQGQLQYRLLARRMTHYPNDERFNLEAPDIRILQASGDNWRIRSEHGETNEDADIIWLLGAVDIRRRQTASSSALHIVTSDLLVKPEEELAETDNAATITSGQFRIEGIGVKADFRNDTLELRSSVRGRYDVIS
ncbi:MAG: LPS export ABC transporter periplasmic protein LptC [Gammaproteobacteria bacterium]